MTKKNRTQLSIRVDIKDRLKEKAEKDGRTMVGEIKFLMDFHDSNEE